MRFVSEEFWASPENEVLLPPHASHSKDEIDRALIGCGLGGAVVFQSSGTAGEAKFVCHSRAGLLASAKAVNKHLEVGEGDKWLCALPLFHVGGFSVFARAFASNIEVFELSGAWEPERFCEECTRVGATLTSLVPAQLYDLVEAGHATPGSLRAVLVGGGCLEPALEEKARALAWPILRTYGLSEAASQVATQRGDEMHVLSHIEAAIGEGGRLKLRGESLLNGYLRKRAGGAWFIEDALDAEGWFQTDDFVELDGAVLRFQGRSSSRVKVLGELVDLDALERSFLRQLPGAWEVALVNLPDPRMENALVLAVAANLERERMEPLLEAFNASLAGFERIARVVEVASIPRGELGKVRRAELRERVIEAEK